MRSGPEKVILTHLPLVIGSAVSNGENSEGLFAASETEPRGELENICHQHG